MTEYERYWLAGLLEGEGSFVWHVTVRDKGRARIQCQMTDVDVVERVAKLIGGTCRGPYGPYKGQLKQTWYAHVSGEQAMKTMQDIYPLMGERRRMQIDNIFNKFKETYN